MLLFSKLFSLLVTLPVFLLSEHFSSCEEGPRLGYLVFSSLPKILTSLTVAAVSLYVLAVMRRLNKVRAEATFSIHVTDRPTDSVTNCRNC